MAENLIGGALSNLGRTFRDLSTARLERQRLDLLGRREEAGQVRALEALRLQGTQQLAEQELEMAREQAAERQLTREFGLKERAEQRQEREAASMDAYREGQIALGQQQAADTRAYQQGSLGIQRSQVESQGRYQQGSLDIQRRRQAHEEQVWKLNEPSRTLERQILENNLEASKLNLQDKQSIRQQWDTPFSLPELKQLFLSQGVSEENANATILGLETWKRATAGPNTEVSDQITLGDATAWGKFSAEMLKLVKGGNDQEALKFAYEHVDKVAGEDATTEDRKQIAEELYLAYKDGKGTETRYRLRDYNREVDSHMQAAAQQNNTTLDKLTQPQRQELRQRAELSVQDSFQRTGKPLPPGVQRIEPPSPAAAPAAPAPAAPAPAPSPTGALPGGPQPTEGLLTFTPGQTARGTRPTGVERGQPRVILPTTPGLTARGTIRPPESSPPSATPALRIPGGEDLNVLPPPPATAPPPPPPGVLSSIVTPGQLPFAVPEGLPRLTPQQVQEVEVFLARGGDPEAAITSLTMAGMDQAAARMAVTQGQLPALRQVLAEEAARSRAPAPTTPAPQALPGEPLATPQAAEPPVFQGSLTPLPDRSREGRPMFLDENANVVTEYTITISDPRINQGRPTNIPSIYNGRPVSQPEAIEIIARSGGIDPDTGRQLPGFGSFPEAEIAAQQRSQTLPALPLTGGQPSGPVSPPAGVLAPSARPPVMEQVTAALQDWLRQYTGFVERLTGGQATPTAVPEGLPRLAPQQVGALQEHLARGGDPAAVVDALVAAGLSPDLARQIPAMRQLLEMQGDLRRPLLPGPQAQGRVLQPIVTPQRGR